MISSARRACPVARVLACVVLTLLGFPCRARAEAEAVTSTIAASTPHPDPLPAARGERERGATPTPTPTPTSIPAPGEPTPPTPLPVGPVASGAPPPGTCYAIGGGRSACYERPRVYDFVLEAPGNLGRWLRDTVRPENAHWVATVALSTAILVRYDQDLVDNTRKGASHLNISAKGKQKDIIPGIPVQYPTDVGSAIYYFGDGMVPAVALTSILGYGLIASDDRALLTASHLGAGLLTTGVTCQVLKHVTGRQTPLRATEPGGKWQWFPDQKKYMKNVPAYDAFPSGHVATLMLTMTVLHDDYPEAWWILPAGWTLMVPLMFQMMNNGVHWASDYPVALAIGYGLGKQATRAGRRVVTGAEASAAQDGPEYSFVPLPVDGGGGLAVVGRF